MASSNILWFFFYALFIFLNIFFIVWNLTPRYQNAFVSKALCCVVTAVPTIAIGLMQRVILNVDGLVFPVASVLIAIALIALLFHEPVYKKALTCFIVFSAYALPYLFEEFILTPIFNARVEEPLVMAVIYIAPISIGTVLCTLYSAARKKNADHPGIKPYYILAFSFFLLSQLVFIIGYALITCSDYFRLIGNSSSESSFFISDRFTFLFSVLSLVIAFAADILFIVVMIRASRNERLREEIEFREHEQRIRREQYDAQQESFRETESLYLEMAETIGAINDTFGCKCESVELENLRKQLNVEFDNLKTADFFERNGGDAVC